MQVLPVWGLAVPLPAVMMITVALYMAVLGVGLWIRYCLKDRCSPGCCSCCPDVSLCERCLHLAQLCDCRLPSLSAFLPSCSAPACLSLDCACTCQPPDCDSCNCLCFEIRIK
ncbi:keratin-associated protein 9-3 [Cyprinodon tularosa]|uniref:keratin-associated protein 9-3 n=1 Tax=Cyprinodon tularosa TaxID=77115 RepID=UPI0018E243DA|nr:keratin-associated protein 9-3 [Cyprinodon tularosa]